ncbi:zinc-ribbon domain-containing protein [Streptomyces roseolilacinus]|uniref:Zinc-ribbon domain-containing protein n=1 Tax=Streptomyces roseolilacinus TaxID=66904 RepID=A0A918AZJ9_9ACTN|nr:zinc-ribbon domain-containing protein [Streptomyces roseolilacinus]GGP92258.1 hypothetical protein GCM10010249_07930 [Streptomyces roseolilacinus]
MASHCPHCGTPSPEEARFCMNCGRERPVAATGPAEPAAPPVPAGPPAAPPGPPAVPAGPPPAGPPAYVPGQASAHPPGPVHPPGPGYAPPGYAPGAVAPSPAAVFLRRAFRGAWAPALRAAAWPTGLLLALAVALAVPSYGQEPGDEVVVGWGDRLRIALTLLLQAFGGGFEVTAAAPVPSRFGDGYDSGSGGYRYGSGDALAQGGAELSVVPLTVTFLWAGALYLAARALRARGAGVDAAVRVSLPAAGAVLVLGLFAQPEVAGIAVSGSPLTAALVALALTLAVTAGVLQRDDLARWLSVRPGTLAAVRALGAATRALGTVLAVCALVGFVTYANVDGVDGTALLLALTILPNLGAAVLGVAWGAPVEYDLRGRFGLLGSGAEHGGFGLPEIGDEWGGWAVTGLLALGVVCALTVGLWAVRRVPGRGGQALAGGLFLGLYLFVAGVGGIGVRVAGEYDDFGGEGYFEVAPSVPDALLFGLLWVGGAVLVAPYLLRSAGGGAGGGGGGVTLPPAPPHPAHPVAPVPHPAAPTTPAPAPGATGPEPPAPPAPAAPAPGPGPNPGPAAGPGTHPAGGTGAYVTATAPTGASRGRRLLLWGGALVVAFAVGGGVTTGLLMLGDEGPGVTVHPRPDAEPVAGTDPTTPAPKATPAPTAAPSGTADAPAPAPTGVPTGTAAPAGPPSVPAGYELVSDTAGFAFAVPSGWDRVSEKQGQITYAGPTGMSHFLVGVVRDAPYTSLENLTTLEAASRKRNADYRRVRLEANTFQGRPGAIWEYTYTDEAGETVHAVDQAYVADDGTEYAVYFTARERDWSEARRTFDVALSTWMLNDVD